MSTEIDPAVASNQFVSADSYGQMIDYLENILARQLERLRNYDLDNAMLIAEETTDIAARLGESRVLDRPEYAENRERISRLYNEIGLIISSERQEVADKMTAIRKAIRTLGAYVG
jgi:hypothetical protein